MSPKASRRQFLSSSSLSIIGSIAGCSSSNDSASRATGSWPMSRYGIRSTGFNPHAKGPTENIRKKWTFEAENDSITAPVVSQNTVYVGEEEGSFYAIDAAGGNKKWEFEPSDGIDGFSDPVIHRGQVYVRSRNGTLYALDPKKGEEVWKSSVGTGSPLPMKDTLYITGDTLNGVNVRTGLESGANQQSILTTLL